MWGFFILLQCPFRILCGFALLFSTCLLPVTSASAMGSAGDSPAAHAMEQKKSPVLTVSVASVRTGELQSVLKAHGQAVPREDVRVSSDISGVHIVEVLAEEGDTVEKGQVLVRLDPEELKLRLASLTAELTRAEEEGRRGKSLQSVGAMSSEEAGQRRTSVLVLQSQVAEARLRLSKAEVTAPASGTIYQRDAYVGGVSIAGEPLFRIAADDLIELEVTVPEDRVLSLGEKTPVEVFFAGDTTGRKAVVRLVSPRISKTTRSAAVRLSLVPSTFVPVGAFCTAYFFLPAKEGLLVPSTALQYDTEGVFVWVVQADDTVVRSPVILLGGDGHTALVSGPREGELIVARAGSFLREGDRIARSGKVL